MYKLSIGHLMKHYRNERRFEGLGLGERGAQARRSRRAGAAWLSYHRRTL